MTSPGAAHINISDGCETSPLRVMGLLGPRPVLICLSALAALAGLVMAGMAFGEVLERVLSEGWLGTDVDRAVSRFTAERRTDRLTGFMRLITDLGSSSWLIAVVLITTAMLLLLRRFRMAAVMVASAVGSAGLTVALKTVIERPRPVTNGEIIFASDSSFPSGHSLESAAIYGALVLIIGSLIAPRGLRIGVWAVGAAVALAIGASRVYLGVHWASDVTAGWMLGFALVASVMGLVFLDRHVEKSIRPGFRMRALALRGSILVVAATAVAAALFIGVQTEV